MIRRHDGAIAFDTHRFVKRLTECGFTERQAETLAEEHVALLNGNLATKADVAAVRAEVVKVEAALKTDIAKVEGALKTDLPGVKANLLSWMFAALIAQGALIVGLVRLL